MSFSVQVRTEVSSHYSSRANAQVAALAAILACIGTFRYDRDDGYTLELNADNQLAVTKCFTLITKTANIVFENSVPGNDTGKGARRLRIPADSGSIRELACLCDFLRDDGSIAPADGTVSWTLLPDDESVRSYVRSMFLCTGSVSDPARQYHLEFCCSTLLQAEQVSNLLSQRGIMLKVAARRNKYVLYSGDAQTIADLLGLMDARTGLLTFEDARVRRGIRGSVNRQVNCEAANIRKTVDASRRQLEDIEKLKASGALAKMSQSLQEMAMLRLDNPDLSYQDLGALCHPPVGKSGVSHRLRKLQEAASRVIMEQEKEESVL